MAKRNAVGRPTPVPITGEQFEMLETALCTLAAREWRYCRAIRGFARNANMPRVLKVVDAIEAANINSQGGLVFDEQFDGVKIVKCADKVIEMQGKIAG